MRLGELIAVARECKGWTLRDLEKVSGVSNALISQIETGKVKDPGFATVVRLVDALGVTLDRAATAQRAKFDVLRRLLPSKQLDRVFIGGGEYVRADEAIKTVMSLNQRIQELEAMAASDTPGVT